MQSDDTTHKVTKDCPTCGISFTRYRCQNAAFCYKKCAALGRHTTLGHRTDYVCELCGAAFSCTVSTRPRRFCSRACEAKGRTVVYTRNCDECGISFSYKKRRDERRFCSIQCASRNQRKEPTASRLRTRDRWYAYHGKRITGIQWREIKERYDFRCLKCGRREPEIILTMDHVIPLSRGGEHEPSNIQPLCVVCNCQKATKVKDFRPSPA